MATLIILNHIKYTPYDALHLKRSKLRYDSTHKECSLIFYPYKKQPHTDKASRFTTSKHPPEPARQYQVCFHPKRAILEFYKLAAHLFSTINDQKSDNLSLI